MKKYEIGSKVQLFNPEGAASMGNAAGALGEVASQFINKESKGGNVASKALKYGAMGAQFGPIGAAAGAVLGTGLGMIENKKATIALSKERLDGMRDQSNVNAKFSRNTYGAISSFKSSMFAKHGARLYKKGGAVILGGRSHDDGGNSIIHGSTGKKIGESESEELLLNSYQTERLESLIADYKKSKNEDTLEDLGRWMTNIIQNETVDNSGKFKGIIV
jgi:hypothetical protein